MPAEEIPFTKSAPPHHQDGPSSTGARTTDADVKALADTFSVEAENLEG